MPGSIEGHELLVNFVQVEIGNDQLFAIKYGSTT